MQGFRASVLCLVLLSSLGVASSADLSPITRCVELLQNLAKQIESESKQEEEMFETYICWGKKVVDTKTASNSAAESRVDMLKQYLADIDAGRVEFTSERQDLEKEIEELTGDLELAKNLREQETKDFEVAEAEMKQAVTALESAVEVLDKATKDHKGSLVAVKATVNENEGFAQRAAEGASLNRAVELGQKFLTKGDAFFLRRLLTGEVPNPDWKKLNRKATFKMSYKARSTKIQSVLKNLLSTFQSNLDDATAKENKAQATYDKLKETKAAQLDKAQNSLAKMEKEMGAKGMSKADAEQEVSDLETQVSNDQKFIKETQESMNTKTGEWKERKKVRASELAAISEAVAILSSDDAKDNFKKSFASQGFFLQMAQSSALVNRARQQIQQLASVTHDARLVTLLKTMEGGHFDAVIKAIDKMIAFLQSEEEKDLTTKQDCEKDRMEDTRDALEGGRAIDDMTDSITSLTAEIKDLNKELDTTNAELDAARKEIAEALKIRKAEKEEWTTSDGQDEQASDTVASAMEVLENFYKQKDALIQRQPAGEAPPPPPATWEGEYKGKMGESNGIIGILKLCKEDIDKDRSAAKSAEDKAQAAYDKARTAFEEQEKALLKTIGELEGQIGERESKVEETTTNRKTKRGELGATLKKIKNADPGCNYIEENYPVRVKNRQIEIDGLQKAKAILQGAAFAKPADENREIKPGDALLQRLRRH